MKKQTLAALKIYIVTLLTAMLTTATRADMARLEWSKDFYPDLETHTFLYKKNKESMHQLHLEAVLFKGSGWKIGDIYSRFLNLNRVLRQCHIEVRSLTVRALTPPKSSLLSPNIDEEAMLDFLNEFPQGPGIRMFYLSRLPISAATAFAEMWYGPNSPITNTILIANKHLTYNDKTKAIGPLEKTKPNVDPHELIHILANDKHDDTEPNLMNSQIKRGLPDNILGSYCESAVQHPQVKFSNEG